MEINWYTRSPARESAYRIPRCPWSAMFPGSHHPLTVTHSYQKAPTSFPSSCPRPVSIHHSRRTACKVESIKVTNRSSTVRMGVQGTPTPSLRGTGLGLPDISGSFATSLVSLQFQMRVNVEDGILIGKKQCVPKDQDNYLTKAWFLGKPIATTAAF